MQEESARSRSNPERSIAVRLNWLIACAEVTSATSSSSSIAMATPCRSWHDRAGSGAQPDLENQVPDRWQARAIQSAGRLFNLAEAGRLRALPCRHTL